MPATDWFAEGGASRPVGSKDWFQSSESEPNKFVATASTAYMVVSGYVQDAVRVFCEVSCDALWFMPPRLAVATMIMVILLILLLARKTWRRVFNDDDPHRNAVWKLSNGVFRRDTNTIIQRPSDATLESINKMGLMHRAIVAFYGWALQEDLYHNDIPMEINVIQTCPDLKVPLAAESMTYERFSTMCKPLDMISLQGSFALGKVIKAAQQYDRGCDIATHVGLLVNTTVLPLKGMIPGEWYVLESCIGGGIIPDWDSTLNIAGQAISGVQIRSLRTQMNAKENEHSLFMWMPLRDAQRVKLNALIRREPSLVVYTLTRHLGKPYTLNLANFGESLANSASLSWLMSWFSRAPNESLVCSELCSTVYIDLGVIDASVTSRMVHPVSYFIGDQFEPVHSVAYHVQRPRC